MSEARKVRAVIRVGNDTTKIVLAVPEGDTRTAEQIVDDVVKELPQDLDLEAIDVTVLYVEELIA